MIRIAVIGDIGSGKSFVAKKFGHPVFDADREVAILYRKNRKCFRNLKKILPGYVTSFPVKKTELARAIVKKHSNLKKIIKIVHPEIQYKMKKFIKKNKNKKIIILDIPLFLENKLNKKNDILIFIDAKKKDINKKLKKKHNLSVKILKKFQLPVELKKKKAAFIIKNNFKSNSIKKSVKIVLEKILTYA